MSEYNQDKETIAAVVGHLNEHASEALAGSLISDGTEGAHTQRLDDVLVRRVPFPPIETNLRPRDDPIPLPDVPPRRARGIPPRDARRRRLIPDPPRSQPTVCSPPARGPPR